MYKSIFVQQLCLSESPVSLHNPTQGDPSIQSLVWQILALDLVHLRGSEAIVSHLSQYDQNDQVEFALYKISNNMSLSMTMYWHLITTNIIEIIN